MRLLLIVILSILYSQAVAQHTREFAFKNYSVLNGLASNAVKDVVQDSYGFIWIATKNGLQRFDGSEFITFKGSDRNFPLSDIRTLFIDSKHRLWVITDLDQVGFFDMKKFTYQPVQIKEEFLLKTIIETPEGELMLLKINDGIYRYDEKNNRFIGDKKLIKLPENWLPHDISWDSFRNKYWVSCDSGMVQYDPAHGRVNYRGNNPDQEPIIAAFGNLPKPNKIFSDKQGNIVFNRWPHMGGTAIFYRYHRKENRIDSTHFADQLGYHEPLGYLEQKSGRLWVYGMPFLGEWPWWQKKLLLVPNEYRNEHSIKYDYIYRAFEDREQNVWLATDNGLFYFNADQQVFNTYKLTKAGAKGAIQAPVHAMQELENGNILVGSWGAGLFYYDQLFRPLPFPKGLQQVEANISVWDMALHPKTKDVWITLQGGGLLIYNQKKDSYIKVYPEIFQKSTIRQIDEDTSGNMWFGTQSGLVVKWDYRKAGNDPGKGYEQVLKTGMVWKIHYDYSGYIYVGTHSHGLLKIDASSNKLVTVISDKGEAGRKLFINSVNDMTYYNDTTLLLSAGCINVLNTRTGKIHFISTKDGLPFNATESVERDEKGIVWVGLTNGICRLNLEQKILTYYDRRDGILYDKFSPTGVKELKNGRLAFFTRQNFLVFDPQRFGILQKPPAPQLTAFYLNGQLLSLDSLKQRRTILLPHHNNTISLSFSSLTFVPQRKIHYYYKLEGLDVDWKRADKPSLITYNYLPHGDFVFKIRSSNADGWTNENILQVPITVRTPFWKTWWFLSLVLLLITTVLYLLDRERMKRQDSMRQLRRQIRGNLKDEVSLALSNINVLSEMAKIKADKNLEQAKVFIDQISNRSRSMIEVMDDTLWTIDPQNDSMAQTVIRIREVTDRLKSAHNIDIDLIVDKKVQMMQVDMKIRHDFLFFYKEALSFLVHYLECKQVFVNVNLVRNKIMLEILAETDRITKDLEIKFRNAVSKRAIPGSLDVLAEDKSFSALLHVDIRK